jgi:hypothetical protein
MYGILAEDVDGDRNADILMAGNFYESKPEVGIYDASYGTVLKRDGKGGFTPLKPDKSGLHITGAARDAIITKAGNQKLVIIAKNNAGLQIAKLK